MQGPYEVEFMNWDGKAVDKHRIPICDVEADKKIIHVYEDVVKMVSETAQAISQQYPDDTVELNYDVLRVVSTNREGDTIIKNCQCVTIKAMRETKNKKRIFAFVQQIFISKVF